MKKTMLVLAISSVFVADPGWCRGHCVPGSVTGYSASYRTMRSGYFPDDSEMEGGYTDRKGRPLHTLQQYLNGEADYVSVAMDSALFRYGTRVRIPEIERAVGRCIEFRVVDTGDRFEGAGSAKVDICNDSEENANSSLSNGWATLYVL